MGSLCLEEIRDSWSTLVPSQLEEGDPPRLWWVVSGEASERIESIYTLNIGRQNSTSLVD
jgi:hypothetical protein